MTNKEIREALRLHVQWLVDDRTGARADFEGANLSGANLSGAILYRANLDGANLTGCRVDVSAVALSNYDLSWWLERGAVVEE